MAKKPFTLESNLDVITEKIHEKPYLVLNKIGQDLRREIRTNIPKDTGKLRKSLDIWARRKEGDLLIGWYNPKRKDFAAFYSHIVMGWEKDPIKPVVLKNAETIKKLIAEALDEIRRE